MHQTGKPVRWTLRNYDVVGQPLSARSGTGLSSSPKDAVGKGQGFDPNPVVALNDETRTDRQPSAARGFIK